MIFMILISQKILNGVTMKYTCKSLFFISNIKGQLNSEWIYEVIVSPKILVGILGETMTS